MANELDFAKLDVFDRIDKIAASLRSNDPMLPMHLAAIHRNLLQYEELVHLLSDDQIKALMAGQKQHVGTQLVMEAVKKRTTKIPKTTVDDL